MGLFGGKTFKPETDIPDQSGRVFLVTGGNVGLGYETIKQLAAHNATIYLAARTPSKGEAAVESLRKLHPESKITYLPLDLSSFESVANAAAEFKSKETRLDCLINNAGIMAVPLDKTKEGYEIQFGTNHMGHALLIKSLLPILESTAKQPGADVRIVNLTSEGHNFARTGPALLQQEELMKSGAWVRYAYSKLANILYARQMAIEHPEILIVSVHPGIVSTDLYAPNQKANPIMKAALAVGGWLRTSVADGALNQLWAATSKKDGIKTGSYYTPLGRESQGNPCARDMKLAKELWDWTEKELSAKGY